MVFCQSFALIVGDMSGALYFVSKSLSFRRVWIVSSVPSLNCLLTCSWWQSLNGRSLRWFAVCSLTGCLVWMSWSPGFGLGIVPQDPWRTIQRLSISLWVSNLIWSKESMPCSSTMTWDMYSKAETTNFYAHDFHGRHGFFDVVTGEERLNSRHISFEL